MSAFASAARPRSILVVHPALPAYDRDAGSLRLWRIVELLLADGHRVTFLGHSAWEQERYAQELRDLGVEVHCWNPEWWRRTHGTTIAGPGIDLPGLLHRGRFDLAWLSTYEMGEFYTASIRHASPATRVLIDSVDVHHVRERRGAELTGDAAALAGAERTRLREQAAYAAADALVAVSAVDAQELTALAPDVPVSVIATIHALPAPGPGFAERDGLVFVGGFDHSPNVDAMLGFAAGPWAAVRAELPEAALAIVGSNPPPAITAVGETPGITVTGWVPETAPYLDAARVSIAPLRFGAGVKGKIGEALSHGLPVVTTTIGAEGMSLVDGETALIADTDEALARAVVRLHRDQALWERLVVAGRDHVERTQGLGATRAALRAALDAVVRSSFVATDAWSEPGALSATLQSYLRAFAADDPVSLVLRVPADGPTLDAAIGRAMDALAGLGADPEQVPDVMVVGAADHVPVPLGGARVGATERREEPVALVAADGAPEAWRAAIADPVPAVDGPLVSVVICTYGKRDYTERCLASLERALGDKLGREVELVLVDNASPDATAELLTSYEDRARVLLLPHNRNFAGGNNAGAEVARGRVLVFLNNDTEVDAGVIEALAEEALRPQVGLAGLRLRYPDGRIQHGGFGWAERGAGDVAPFHLFHSEDGELPAARATFDTSAVTGACIAIRAELFEALGGFDEAYVNGWEDVDLCQRVRAAGGRVRYRGDLEVLHHEGITGGGSYDVGNRKLFYERWGKTLGADDDLIAPQLGARLGPAGAVGGTELDGAGLVVVGPVAGLGPAGAEARGLVRGLLAAGRDVAARTAAPTWVRPQLTDAEQTMLDAAQARSMAPSAAAIVVADGSVAGDLGGTSRLVLRLTAVPPTRPAGAVAWAATPALAAELIAAGWPPEAVVDLPPAGITAIGGTGGDGILAFLPEHDEPATAALLRALSQTDLPVALMPTSRTPELAHRVAAVLPDATLLSPVHDEALLAELAAGADIVVALDADDPYDRRALVAAGAGAAVVVRADGPAASALGTHALIATPATLAHALATADTSATARATRTALIAETCAPSQIVDALRALTPPRRAASVAA
jgi:GT2 family glycosyltransferase/glycosyltransferase involved in cell wall biosynthesis